MNDIPGIGTAEVLVASVRNGVPGMGTTEVLVASVTYSVAEEDVF
jgi:hypothetical protein